MEDDKFPIQTIDPAVFKMRNRNRKSADKSKSEKYWTTDVKRYFDKFRNILLYKIQDEFLTLTVRGAQCANTFSDDYFSMKKGSGVPKFLDFS